MEQSIRDLGCSIVRSHEWRSVCFLDAEGKLCVIRGCVEQHIPELAKVISLILNRVGLSPPNSSFFELYRGDLLFGRLCDRAIELMGVDPQRLTADMIREFVLPYERDGQIHPSLISELSFPLSDEAIANADAQITWEQRQASFISALISTGLAKDFQGAWAMLKEFNAEQLTTFIEERTEARSGDRSSASKPNREEMDLIQEIELNPELLLDFSGMPMLN